MLLGQIAHFAKESIAPFNDAHNKYITSYNAQLETIQQKGDALKIQEYLFKAKEQLRKYVATITGDAEFYPLEHIAHEINNKQAHKIYQEINNYQKKLAVTNYYMIYTLTIA